MKKNGDTGEYEVRGRTTSWWISRVAAVLLTLNTLGLGWVVQYLWNHGYDHKTLTEQSEQWDDFMSQGDRVYSSTGAPISTDQLKLESLTDAQEWVNRNFPPDWLKEQVSEIKAGVDSNQQDIKELLRRVR